MINGGRNDAGALVSTPISRSVWFSLRRQQKHKHQKILTTPADQKLGGACNLCSSSDYARVRDSNETNLVVMMMMMMLMMMMMMLMMMMMTTTTVMADMMWVTVSVFKYLLCLNRIFASLGWSNPIISGIVA